jgi:hypothetical protein
MTLSQVWSGRPLLAELATDANRTASEFTLPTRRCAWRMTGLRRIIGSVTYSPEQFAGSALSTTTIREEYAHDTCRHCSNRIVVGGDLSR